MWSFSSQTALCGTEAKRGGYRVFTTGKLREKDSLFNLWPPNVWFRVCCSTIDLEIQVLTEKRKEKRFSKYLYVTFKQSRSRSGELRSGPLNFFRIIRGCGFFSPTTQGLQCEARGSGGKTPWGPAQPEHSVSAQWLPIGLGRKPSAGRALVGSFPSLAPLAFGAKFFLIGLLSLEVRRIQER